MKIYKLMIMCLFCLVFMFASVSANTVYHDTLFSQQSCGDFVSGETGAVQDSYFMCKEIKEGLQISGRGFYMYGGDFKYENEIVGDDYNNREITTTYIWKITGNSEYNNRFFHAPFIVESDGTEIAQIMEDDNLAGGSYVNNVNAESIFWDLRSYFSSSINYYDGDKGNDLWYEDTEYLTTVTNRDLLQNCMNEFCVYQFYSPENSRETHMYVNGKKVGELGIFNFQTVNQSLIFAGKNPVQFTLKRFKVETGNYTGEYEVKDSYEIGEDLTVNETLLSKDFRDYTNVNDCNSLNNIFYSNTDTSTCEVSNGKMQINGNVGDFISFVPNQPYESNTKLTIKFNAKINNNTDVYGERTDTNDKSLGNFTYFSDYYKYSDENFTHSNTDYNTYTIHYNPYTSYTVYSVNGVEIYRKNEDFTSFSSVLMDIFEISNNENPLDIDIQWIQIVKSEDWSSRYLDVERDIYERNFTPSSSCFGSTQCLYADDFETDGLKNILDYNSNYDTYYNSLIEVNNTYAYFVPDLDNIPYFGYDIEGQYNNFYYTDTDRYAEAIRLHINPELSDTLINTPVTFRFHTYSFGDTISTEGLKISYNNETETYNINLLNFINEQEYNEENGISLTKQELSDMNNEFVYERIVNYPKSNLLIGIKDFKDSYYNIGFNKDTNSKLTKWEWHRLEPNNKNNAKKSVVFDTIGYYALGDIQEDEEYITDLEGMNETAPYGETDTKAINNTIQEKTHNLASMFGFRGMGGRIIFWFVIMIISVFWISTTSKIDDKSKLYAIVGVLVLEVFTGWYMEFLPTNIMIVIIFMFSILAGIFIKNMFSSHSGA